MGEGAFIDTDADPGAWSDALAAPCSYRTIANYEPEAVSPSTCAAPSLTGASCAFILSCAGRLGLFHSPSTTANLETYLVPRR